MPLSAMGSRTTAPHGLQQQRDPTPQAVCNEVQDRLGTANTGLGPFFWVDATASSTVVGEGRAFDAAGGPACALWGW